MDTDLPQIVEFDASGERLAERALPPAAPPSGRSRKGTLYAMVEIAGDRSGQAADALGRDIADAFYRDNTGSITSSLLRAIQRLNEALFDENERSILAERQFATVVCAVVRDADIYLGIVGPGRAYLIGEGPTQCIRRSEDEAGRPDDLLGQADEVRVEMFHRSFDPAGVMILTTGGLIDLLDQAMAQVPDIPPDRGIPLIRFLAPRRATSFRAVAVDFSAESPVPSDADAVATTRSRLPRLPLRLPALGQIGRGTTTSPRPGRDRSASPASEDLIDAASAVRATTTQSPPPTFVERRGRSPSPYSPARSHREAEKLENDVDLAPDRNEPEDHRPRTAASSRRYATPRAASSQYPRRSGYAFDPKPSIEHYAAIGDVPDRGFDLGNRGLRGSIQHLVTRRPLPRQVLFGLILVAIFAIGVFIVQVPLRWIQNGTTYAAIVSRLAQAEQQERAALAQSDPQARRQQLEEARRLALAAQELGPENTAVATTVARIQSEYQSAAGVVTLPRPTRLIDLPSSGDRMVLRGIDLYVLDRSNSRVYKYLLNADGTAVQPHTDPTLVRRGDRIGTRTAGDLTQMTWMPAGGTRTSPALLILDRAGFLIQYESVHGLSVLALREPKAWGSVTAIDGLDGNLYALSPASRVLAWYPPQSTGYDGAAYNYFAPTTDVDLSDAAGFSLNDGLYLVSASGRIQKFDGGKPVSFAGPPAGLAPRHPSGLAIGGGSVLVGDPGNARIVQIGLNGTYQQVLGGDGGDATLGQIRDLAVSDNGRALYVLSERAIDRYELPPPVR